MATPEIKPSIGTLVNATAEGSNWPTPHKAGDTVLFYLEENLRSLRLPPKGRTAEKQLAQLRAQIEKIAASAAFDCLYVPGQGLALRSSDSATFIEAMGAFPAVYLPFEGNQRKTKAKTPVSADVLIETQLVQAAKALLAQNATPAEVGRQLVRLARSAVRQASPGSTDPQ
jgi:hypothetical protein